MTPQMKVLASQLKSSLIPRTDKRKKKFKWIPESVLQQSGRDDVSCPEAHGPASSRTEVEVMKWPLKIFLWPLTSIACKFLWVRYWEKSKNVKGYRGKPLHISCVFHSWLPPAKCHICIFLWMKGLLLYVSKLYVRRSGNSSVVIGSSYLDP